MLLMVVLSALSLQGYSLEDSIKRGSANAAIVVTKVGCSSAMPDSDELENLLINKQWRYRCIYHTQTTRISLYLGSKIKPFLLVYFNIINLKKGESYSYQLPQHETSVVPATGIVELDS